LGRFVLVRLKLNLSAAARKRIADAESTLGQDPGGERIKREGFPKPIPSSQFNCRKKPQTGLPYCFGLVGFYAEAALDFTFPFVTELGRITSQ
jgi:hypothetical protein